MRARRIAPPFLGLLSGGLWTLVRRGGSSTVAASGTTPAAVSPPDKFDYDILVIGGGSGGLAAAKRAAEHGARVALCDYVTPSPHGTKWGLGGTCVNVGCIPKKLMHQAALLAKERVEGHAYGLGTKEHNEATTIVDWMALQANIDEYIRSLNWGYKSALQDKDVKYLNARAAFRDRYHVECVNAKGQTSIVSAKNFIIAVGGRPAPLEVPGGAAAITSDDLFRRPVDPGTTLVVGSGVVGLECAGMLQGIGRKATIMMRSIPLRGCDQDMARRALAYMKDYGVDVIEGAVPSRVIEMPPATSGGGGGAEGSTGRPQYKVEYANPSDKTQTLTIGPFDTVLYAAGRKPLTGALGLEALGVQLASGSKKILVDHAEQTSVNNIFAIGDVTEGRPELTPPAIKAGELLADRLCGKSTRTLNYQHVPMTVFTPLEYGFVGLSEEAAREAFGDRVEVYHSNFAPLEWALPHRPTNACYMKLIVDKMAPGEKVLGFHVLAPNAGEITQGVAVALKAGATKATFDDVVGIHPTIAENMISLNISKSSGKSPEKTGC